MNSQIHQMKNAGRVLEQVVKVVVPRGTQGPGRMGGAGVDGYKANSAWANKNSQPNGGRSSGARFGDWKPNNYPNH